MLKLLEENLNKVKQTMETTQMAATSFANQWVAAQTDLFRTAVAQFQRGTMAWGQSIAHAVRWVNDTQQRNFETTKKLWTVR